MKKAVMRILLFSMTGVFLNPGGVYAAEPVPSFEDYDISLEEAEEMYGDYELSTEEKEELERSVSESKAEFDSERERKGYKSLTDPELKISYDRDAGTFVYRMPNGADFSLTAPLGGISGETVTLRSGNFAYIVSLFRDGRSALPEPERFKTVSEALASVTDERALDAELPPDGEYLFHIRSSRVTRSGTETNDSFAAVRVVREDSPIWINVIFPPCGYGIGEAFVDGRAVPVTDGSRLELPEDGRYEIHFKPLSGDLPEWVSRFKRDTRAPLLKFTPELTGGIMKTPVSFSPSEKGARVRVFLNNTEISLYNSTAAADGGYRIVVSDATGNENDYEFVLKLEEQAPVKMYLIMIVAAIGIAVLVIMTEHRRMRII